MSFGPGIWPTEETTSVAATNEFRKRQLLARLANPAVSRFTAGMANLAALPETYSALTRALSDENASTADIANIIETDPTVSVRLLQVVNSTFFGTAKRTSSIHKAVGIMGTDLLRSLVLSAQMSSAIALAPNPYFSMTKYQNYSIRVARLARRFAGTRACADEAFTAGLMLGVGQIVLALRAPSDFEAILRRVAGTGERQHEVERELLGTTHAEIGAFLLSSWCIPFNIVECVAMHQQPSEVGPGDVELLALVHAAHALSGIVACREPETQLDGAIIERAGFGDELPHWRIMTEEICEHVP
jgi:HD-like signal output (HDOD) protein